MAYLGAVEAIRARLEGNPFNFVPQFPGVLRNLDPRDAGRETTPKLAEVVTYLTRATTASLARGKIQVPVYAFDFGGRRVERVYPSFSIEMLSVKPRYDESFPIRPGYAAENYQIPVPGSEEEVLDGRVSLGRRPRMITSRPVETPMDFLFEIRAYSTDPMQSAMLVDHVYKRFPPRHYLRVPLQDGTYRSWDLEFRDFLDTDSRAAVIRGLAGAEREYAKVWTYRLEAYLDNTEELAYVNLVRQRLLETEQKE